MDIDGGIVAIVRLRAALPVDAILEALVEGGVRCVEITLPTPGSEDAVARWRDTPDVSVGMGTIRTPDDVLRAKDAGAAFLVTPTTSLPVLQRAADVSLPVVCGALSPTEIDSAHQAGASLIKVFPVDAVGGLDYLRAVAAPLDNVRFVPTGGIGVAQVHEYARFGCAGVGIGSALVSEALVESRDWTSLRNRAAAMSAAWESGVAAGA